MLKHKTKSDFTTATIFGAVTFNAQGESNDLTEAQQKELASKVDLYTFVEPKKAAPKKEDSKKEVAKETEPKKAAPKKAPKDKDSKK